jgi:hypothetical protein
MQPHRNHAAESTHLVSRKSVALMAVYSRVDHVAYLFPCEQFFGDSLRIGGMLLHLLRVGRSQG